MWSPDGTTIAFLNCESQATCQHPQVNRIHADGTGLGRVTNERSKTAVNFLGLWWSPDAKRLYFGVYRF
jgi:Tol biopolymer transport system component